VHPLLHRHKLAALLSHPNRQRDIVRLPLLQKQLTLALSTSSLLLFLSSNGGVPMLQAR
jgi:hypothetical protein